MLGAWGRRMSASRNLKNGEYVRKNLESTGGRSVLAPGACTRLSILLLTTISKMAAWGLGKKKCLAPGLLSWETIREAYSSKKTLCWLQSPAPTEGSLRWDGSSSFASQFHHAISRAFWDGTNRDLLTIYFQSHESISTLRSYTLKWPLIWATGLEYSTWYQFKIPSYSYFLTEMDCDYQEWSGGP